ncbi:MAG TPA: hypothetical protein VMH78_08000, partial [Thermoplasmata archaeon]|nr:hypothetical protein [Thermoplasmata archaeon]
MLTDDLLAWVRELGLPVGGIVVGVAIGAGLFVAMEWLARRPTTTSSGTSPIHLVDAPADAAAGRVVFREDGIPIAPARVTATAGTRTVYLEGAGASPNARLPRARRFLGVLVAAFSAL